MKVLIVSAEVWQDGTNGGNVLSNIFADSGFEFAQIYCNPGTPQNKLCKRYYQMTDSMVIRNVLKKGNVGRSFELEQKQEQEPTVEQPAAEQPNKSFYQFFHKYRLGIFYAAKEIAWNICAWKNDCLKQFLDDFQADVIFAPCYGSKFMLKLTRFVADYTGKKVISYISDDSYTLNHFSASPYFWINRFIVRRELRKTFPYYSLVYTMTEEQKAQCERDLHGNMKILRKAKSFAGLTVRQQVNKPIRIVYAGGIYLNRWKTLRMLVREMETVDPNGELFKLDIYTGNEIFSKIDKALNDGKHSTIHSAVAQDELLHIYKSSDIALHVESFDIKNRLLVRLSFSTKIVDCLSSGCAVMAVCDKKQAGYCYLQAEDAAFCLDSRQAIREQLVRLKETPDLVISYAEKAWRCLERNHDAQVMRNMIKRDFEQLV